MNDGFINVLTKSQFSLTHTSTKRR